MEEDVVGSSNGKSVPLQWAIWREIRNKADESDR